MAFKNKKYSIFYIGVTVEAKEDALAQVVFG